MLASSRMLSTSPSTAGATCARRPNRDVRPDQRRCRPRPRARDGRRWHVRSFGNCRTRRRRLRPQTRRGAERPNRRPPAQSERNGSEGRCMCPPAMRHACQPAGNLPGRHPRNTPAHTGNRPTRPSRCKPQRPLPDRQAQRRARLSQLQVQRSLQLPGRLRPYPRGDSHAFVPSRTPLHLPGQASRIARGFCPLHSQYDSGQRFLARDFKYF